MMKAEKLSVLLVVIVLLSACSSGRKKEQTISLSGAFALYPLVVKWSEEYQNEHPGIRFNISAGGAGKGMADALSETVDLGMFSRAISPEEKAKGVWWVAVTKDAVIPTVNVANPVWPVIQKRGLTHDELRRIYVTGEIIRWNQLPGISIDEAINVYTRSDACGAAGTWAAYLGGRQEDLKGIGVFGDPGLADAVVKDEKGVGYNNTIYLYNVKTGRKNPGIEVIPIDVNGNGTIDANENFYDTFNQVLEAIGNGAYPSPPARDLYLVAKGKPQKQATLDFLKWIVTKGQVFVSEAGYVPLPKEVLDEQVTKLQQ
ncbi:PstS family phosphate ABC transporter substrate-binding protein [Prolixibacter denitrificans]|uniref:Phosphate transport system substrate-binding protein n=1 Tax=Prolixibacter denitrificans TaxID=1541063 RepID=A0A2P8CBS3_9BACT|nr:substrate-binding domain-containing protein [Prolixibacter denitrificans]PSK82420.1 phosphate transport system substrate-binding protein [Prolixibacter denitrificans]GET22838.1 phosphate-binding protein [Prolixibacter denitrificans]